MKHIPLTRWALLTVTAVLAVGLSSCNTMRGAGRDVQKAGHKIENAAENASR